MNPLLATGSAVALRLRRTRGDAVEGKHPPAVRRSRLTWHRGRHAIFNLLCTLLHALRPAQGGLSCHLI